MGVSFADIMLGIVVGDSGTILTTTNGGSLWVHRNSGLTTKLWDVKLVDAENAIAVGEHGVILRTVDGGRSWTRDLIDFSGVIRSITASDPLHFVVVGDSGMFGYSTDGGATWKSGRTLGRIRLNRVRLTSLLTGIAVGDSGEYYLTTDGGAHWNSTPVMFGSLKIKYRLDDVSVHGNDIVLHAVSLQNGAIASVVVLISSNQGIEWSPYFTDFKPSDSEMRVPLLISSEGHIYLGIGAGVTATAGIDTLVRSKLGGGTFGVQSLDLIYDILTIVGDGGLIARTNQAGWSTPVPTVYTQKDSITIELSSWGWSSLQFRWQPFSRSVSGWGNGGYQLRVSPDSTFSTNVVLEASTQDSAMVLDYPTFGTKYFYQVMAYGTFGTNGWSEISSVTTREFPFEATAALLQPQAGGTNVDLELEMLNDLQYTMAPAVQLRWTSCKAYLSSLGELLRPSYYVELSKDSLFRDIQYPSETTDTLWIAKNGLSPLTQYFWRVQSIYGNYRQPWSPTLRFTTGDGREKYPIVQFGDSMKSADPEIIMRRGERPMMLRKWLPYPDKSEQGKPPESAQFAIHSQRVNGTGNLRNVVPIDSGFVPIRDPLHPFRWRISARYSIGGSNWTDFQTIAGHFKHYEIKDIQHSGQGDSLTGMSQVRDSLVSVVARCVVPAQILTKYGQMMIVSDTGALSSAWVNLPVIIYPYWTTNDPSFLNLNIAEHQQDFMSRFLTVRKGDCIRLTGFITENSANFGNTTILQCLTLEIISSADRLQDPPLVSLEEFRMDDPDVLPSGERWEGAIVRLQDLTVRRLNNASDGAFQVCDSSGDVLNMIDLSTNFTLARHKAASSGYQVPNVGAHLSLLRGVLLQNSSGYMIAPIFPGDMIVGTPPPHSIRGVVFSDINGDGIFNSDERPLSGVRVILDGTASTSTITDSAGRYAFEALDRGSYSVSVETPAGPWDPGIRMGPDLFLFGLDSAAGNVSFRFVRHWSTVTGRVFEDLNESGTWEENEPGVPGVRVDVIGPNCDFAITDSAGYYTLRSVDLGLNRIVSRYPANWDRIYPIFGDTLVVSVRKLDQALETDWIAVERRVPKVKLSLIVHDNIPTVSQTLWWGVRGGATTNIFGANAIGSSVDFAEHEAELPPTYFPFAYRFFDARFQDPAAASAPWGESERFGEGSWTDMRNFSSIFQIDTFRVTFLPGYLNGGDYPMTLVWDHSFVSDAFSGAVDLTGPNGLYIDMRTSDSIVVTDPNIAAITIVAHGPILPSSSTLRWNLVSVPTRKPFESAAVFRAAQSSSFGFSPLGGYVAEPVMKDGHGYWLKVSLDRIRPLDGSQLSSGPETLQVLRGWNLLGFGNMRGSVRSIHSSIANLITSIYKYGWGYEQADSIQPYSGYWVNAACEGAITFNNMQMLSEEGTLKPSRGSQIISLRFTEKGPNSQSLGFITRSVGKQDLSFAELPPPGPADIPDIRFADGRWLECLNSVGKHEEFPLRFGGNISYPLQISVMPETNADQAKVWFKRGDKLFALTPNTPLQITDALRDDESLSLVVEYAPTNASDVPVDFALEQNYPNPFNPTTLIQYGLPEDSRVTITVFDMLGRVVALLADGIQAVAGYHSISWNASNCASGIYFVRISAAGTGKSAKTFTATIKASLLK